MSEEFDEALYLNANPDVRAMIASGSVTSALEHWRSTGAAEHSQGLRRSGFYEYDLVYDEDAYLRDNEDVAAAVKLGALRDGYEHWIRFGRRECAEGRRNGSFGTKEQGLRPFAVPVGAHGVLLVAPSPRPLPPVERLVLRVDHTTTLNLEPESVVCTPELALVDQSGRAGMQRLLLFWVPAGLVPPGGTSPRVTTITITPASGALRTVSFTGLDEQKPSFANLDAASAFVLAARHLGDRHDAPLLAAVSDLVCARSFVAPPADGQPLSAGRVERLVGVEGAGIYATGWLVPANPLLERCRAWCPETGEIVEFHGTMARARRPDVGEAFKSKVGATTANEFGFSAMLALPEASRLPECLLVVGITPRGGAEHLLAPVKCKPSDGFVDAAKVVLASLNPASPDFEATMRHNIGPALAGLWSTERARKSRKVHVRTFGERPAKPRTSVVVPLYGRSDFIKYQLSLFANDPDFRNGTVELVYFVDDPRIIEDVLQLCLSLSPMYQVPMIVAYTGDNHGFSGANNLGVSVARGELLVLLNSDVMPKKGGWVTELARIHETLPDCGVLGAKLLYYDESLQHDGMIFERFPFWNGLYGNNHPGKGLPNRSEPGAPAREVEAVTGALLVLSAALYRQLGGLSESFVFGDFEDSELCLRVRDAGKRIYYAPAVELYHLERQSQSLVPDGDSWRWQITVYNAWIQHEKWGASIDDLKRSPVSTGTRKLKLVGNAP